jgi:hypothetical protein
MLAVSGVALLPGVLFLWISIPLLFGNRPGDFAGGVAGSLIGLILIGASVAAFVAARRSSRSFRISFHLNGVFAGRGDALEYFPYDSLQSMLIEIYEPSATKKTLAIARGALSLAAGNPAGVGWASGSLKSCGSVQFRTADGREFFSTALPARALEEVGSAVEPIRGETVVSRVSV